MELIIEEIQETQTKGLDPFKDFKLPQFLRKVEQNGKSRNNNQFYSTFGKSVPREPFKQPSYHQKYQQTYKNYSTKSQQQQQQTQSFSYDHILNSLNMKVNGGKLEYIPPNPNSLEKTKNKIINHYFQSQQQIFLP